MAVPPQPPPPPDLSPTPSSAEAVPSRISPRGHCGQRPAGVRKVSDSLWGQVTRRDIRPHWDPINVNSGEGEFPRNAGGPQRNLEVYIEFNLNKICLY